MTGRRGWTGDAEQRLTVLDSLPDSVLVLDVNFNLVWANRAAERLFGVPVEEVGALSPLEMVHPDDLEFVLLSMETVQGKVTGSPVEVRVKALDGWRLVEVVGSPVPDLGVVAVCIRDLTDRRRWEVAGDEVELFRSLVHNGAGLTMLLDPDGCVRSASGALTRALGLDPEQLEGRPLHDAVHPADRPALDDILARQESTAFVEVRLITRAGNAVPYELSVVNLLEDPVVGGYVVSGHDVSRLHDVQLQLEELANRDALTGLPNRAALDRYLAQALERIRAHPEPLVVAFVDLDQFKPVNDRFGHDAGDEVIRLVAERMRAAVRDHDVVARFGGDEFVVVATLSENEVPPLAGRLEAALAQPFDLATARVQVTASVGWAMASSTHTSGSLLAEADARMYEAKRARSEAES